MLSTAVLMSTCARCTRSLAVHARSVPRAARLGANQIIPRGVDGARRTRDAGVTFITRAEATETAEASAGVDSDEQPLHTTMDFRVGRIIEVADHPDADSLYVEQIEVGEAEPRTIVSGLVKYCKKEDLMGRMVVIVANLKPRNMRGIRSNGMLLCTSNPDHSEVEPLVVPEGAKVGERVWFGLEPAQPEAWAPNKVQKKKAWEAVSQDLKTGDDKVARFKDLVMMCSGGALTSSRFPNSPVT